MSQEFQWPCRGKCGVLFTHGKDTFKRRYCHECGLKRKEQRIKASRPRKRFTTMDGEVLYAIKQCPCNLGMLASLTGKTRQLVSMSIWRLKKNHNITVEGEFYIYGGKK